MALGRRRSWVESANDPETDFPVENLPLGLFRPESKGWVPAHQRVFGTSLHVGVAIGDRVLDLFGCKQHLINRGFHVPLTTLDGSAFKRGDLRALRERIAELLTDAAYETDLERWLIPQSEAQMVLPVNIGDYTDFYASIHHATNVGRLFRPDNPLLPNYKYVPIGYHGRASSIVITGTEIRRPSGQMKIPDANEPSFGPSAMLDYELEVGMVIGTGNPLGSTIPVDYAEERILGLCLVNDWSARDIQSWEYQPLGPFLGKSFATTMSPWLVTLEALRPYRVPVAPRPQGDPQPLPYLFAEQDQRLGALDVTLEVSLLTARMRAAGERPFIISQGNLRDLYWTPSQMIAHHTSNGCNLREGDLMATGTVSGPTPESVGSLLERTQRGTQPLELPNGEQRRFLEDGDEVILRGWCEREGLPRIGFGECRGMVLPAIV